MLVQTPRQNIPCESFCCWPLGNKRDDLLLVNIDGEVKDVGNTLTLHQGHQNTVPKKESKILL